MSAEPRFPTTADDARASRPHLSVVPDQRPVPGKEQRRPLSRALATRSQSNRWRVFLGLGAMLLALLIVLGLSITMASRQYDLVELRATEQALSQQNEALAQEIEFHQAPQDLAIRASQLGMVTSPSRATINLSTGEISGVPMAAQEPSEATDNLIAPPALADTQAYEEASIRAEEERKKKEAEAKEAEAKEAEAKASASATASASAAPTSSAQPTQAPADR
ncbi:hypothetical protein [Rothia sp. (in: high G+C Gram-positive bacteria)]|uniref:hypothetical protein n=1 Tax=Rothia sp. (in: high G+C Gram-positive bacteria) TaxID=1885016 RepID=UPI003216BE68